MKSESVECLAAGEDILLSLPAADDGREVSHRLVVATNHGERVQRLKGRYVPWHFRETLTPEGLTFGYRRRTGAASTRTAIALLKASGASASLVETARERAGPLPPGRKWPLPPTQSTLMRMVEELQSISRESIPASVFEISWGCREIRLSDLMSGGN